MLVLACGRQLVHRRLVLACGRQPACSSIVTAAIATVVTVVTAVPCSARSPYRPSATINRLPICDLNRSPQRRRSRRRRRTSEDGDASPACHARRIARRDRLTIRPRARTSTEDRGSAERRKGFLFLWAEKIMRILAVL